MGRLKLAVRKTTAHGKVRWYVREPTLDGSRKRRFFSSKRDAETFLQLKETEQTNFGVRAASLTEEARSDFLWCEAQLEPYGLSIRQAVETLLPQLKAREHSLSVFEAAERLLTSKRAVGVSEKHLYTLSNRLSRFGATFGARPLSSLSLYDIEQWLHGLPVGAQSVNHYKATLHSLFAYGVKIGACRNNPVAGIDSRKVVRGAPSILTPMQLSAFLAACDPDSEMLGFVAIGAFAGLRRSEIHRLKWEHINFTRGFITVEAENSKNSRRRLVPVCDALRLWLGRIKGVGLIAPTKNFRRRFVAVRRAAGLLNDWEGNELRHSYASYRLAQVQDEARVALECGNSSAVLRQHYMELATPEEAAAWFAVTPSVPD